MGQVSTGAVGAADAGQFLSPQKPRDFLFIPLVHLLNYSKLKLHPALLVKSSGVAGPAGVTHPLPRSTIGLDNGIDLPGRHSAEIPRAFDWSRMLCVQ